MRIIILVAILCLLGMNVYSDVYIVTDKNTDEVVSVSNENDCVVTNDMKLKVIKNKDLKDITIVQPPQYYKLQGETLVPNMKKIQDKEKAELVAYETAQELEMINKRTRKIAFEQLKAEGKEFKHIKAEE